MTTAPTNVNYTFSERELDQLRPYGTVQSHGAGEVLIREGEREIEVLVVLAGVVEAYVHDASGEQRVAWMEPGQFLGDISVLTGHSTLATVVVKDASEVLHIPHHRFIELLGDVSHLSDIFVRVLTARREWAFEREASSVMVIGPPYDRSVFAIRDLLAKHGIQHVWYNPETDAMAEQVMNAREITADMLPVLIRGRGALISKPKPDEVADALGLAVVPENAEADVLVVGAGPAGLAASVYAASEGLSVIALDGKGPGGQAGTSSKIENYLGFPMGISGRDLADRAAMQAQKFGVLLASPASAKSVQRDGERYRVHLEDGKEVCCKTLVVATGADYRRLPLERLEEFEGRGIYYGATPMEAQLCQKSRVTIVGAGNSAGQGAVFLSQTSAEVHVLYRRADIRETMSEYLVRRLEDAPNIHLHAETEIVKLNGTDPEESETRLLSIDVRTPAGAHTLDTPFVFLFIGAAPRTEWLPETVCRDKRGFLNTGSDITPAQLVRAGWDLERMPTRFETSWPRIYAVGDVRAGAVKRVASAVGEGSVVISDVHKALREVE